RRLQDLDAAGSRGRATARDRVAGRRRRRARPQGRRRDAPARRHLRAGPAPRHGVTVPAPHHRGRSTMSATTIPLRSSSFSAAEWKVRVELAAAYRLIHHWGWTALIYNHITARVPGDKAHYLINSYGLLYDEVTASNLVKVDLDGTIVEGPPGAEINL